MCYLAVLLFLSRLLYIAQEVSTRTLNLIVHKNSYSVLS